MTRYYIKFLIAGWFLTIWSPALAQDFAMSSNMKLDPKHPAYLADEIIVKFRDHLDVLPFNGDNSPGVNSEEVNAILQRTGCIKLMKVFRTSSREDDKPFFSNTGSIKELPSLFNIFRLQIEDHQNIPELIEYLNKQPEVEWAEPNYVIYAIETIPNDLIYQAGAQWHLDSIDAPAAWDLITGDTSQVIAILDTGVEWDHPDLAANIWTNWDEVHGNGMDDDENGFIDDTRGWDLINEDNNPTDDNAHGTHVAGIAAAMTDNSIGVAGVNWNAQIMPVKMLQSTGNGNAADFAEAIQYAWLNGATVINMSVGSYGESYAVRYALEYAYSSATLVASAGNDFYNMDLAPMYPACYSFVLGVESSDFDNGMAFFTNFDIDGPIESTHPDLYNYEVYAPGIAIYSTFREHSYHALSGTSMSAPIISGCVALLRSYFPGISNEKIFVRMIQGSENSVVNLYKQLTFTPIPYLNITNISFLDTLAGSDADGIIDAGETIQIQVAMRNCGWTADSVYALLRLGYYEDTTVAVVLDSLSFLGNISEYATMDNHLNLFKVQISPHVVHKRDIVFSLTSWGANTDTIQKEYVINVQNAQSLAGVMDTTMVLTPDKLWVVNKSFRVGINGILRLMPGTTLELQKELVNWGRMEGYGTPDSIITIYGPGAVGGSYEYTYTHFYYMMPKESDSSRINDKYLPNRISHCYIDGYGPTNLTKVVHSTLINNQNQRFGDTIIYCNMDAQAGSSYFNHNYFAYNNMTGIWTYFFYEEVYPERLGPNNFLTTTPTFFYTCPTLHIPPQYYGTTDTAWIDQHIYDFEESLEWCPQAKFTPVLQAPTPLAPGCVWKIHINGVNPQEVSLDPIGMERVKFEVYFSRPMDTAYTPQLSFGVRSPYNQHIVSDDAAWSSDSLVWTAYYNIGLETGDGMNYLRVQDARDEENMIIPVEYNKRFYFMIQAAGSQSIPFTAQPGIGRCTLTWSQAASGDVLGYNLYRCTSTTDTVRVNEGFILLDTTYTDYAVIPDTSYRYLYKVIGTDFKESDYSRSIECTPVPAEIGDANGDSLINVLDISTVISHILQENPLPFLYDAADANDDNTIDVLDIISIINIILGESKSSFMYGLEPLEPAYLLEAENEISLKSLGQVCAVQFNLAGVILDQLQLNVGPEGFILATRSMKGSLTGIIYSPKNQAIPSGIINLLKVSDMSNPFDWGDFLAGDQYGRQVPLLKISVEAFPENFSTLLKAYPNPSTSSVTITYDLDKPCHVILTLVNQLGEILETIDHGYRVAGNHNTRIASGKLSPGMYFCKIYVEKSDGKAVSDEIKIILMK